MSEHLGAPDPFWATVHRRHPDVDLVILPPEVPVRPTGTVDATVDATIDDRGVLEHVAATAARLWAAGVPESGVEPSARWSYAADPGAVRATARATERRDDGFPVLVTLRHELEVEGWRVRRAGGAVERLLAERDGVDLVASYAEGSGALLLSVASAPLRVGAVRARSLVRGGR